MYTATTDSLALPLALDHLLSEPKHGKLLQGNKCRAGLSDSAVFTFEAYYIYIPNDEFIGIEEFDFLAPNGSRMTLIIHVIGTKKGYKQFIPFIKESTAATDSTKLQTFA